MNTISVNSVSEIDPYIAIIKSLTPEQKIIAAAVIAGMNLQSKIMGQKDAQDKNLFGMRGAKE